MYNLAFNKIFFFIVGSFKEKKLNRLSYRISIFIFKFKIYESKKENFL